MTRILFCSIFLLFSQMVFSKEVIYLKCFPLYLKHCENVGKEESCEEGFTGLKMLRKVDTYLRLNKEKKTADFGNGRVLAFSENLDSSSYVIEKEISGKDEKNPYFKSTMYINRFDLSFTEFEFYAPIAERYQTVGQCEVIEPKI